MKEYLDDFVLVYVNNNFIYFNSSQIDYIYKVRLVLKKVNKAGLYLNPNEYELIIKRVKYLRFIVYIGVRIKPDPEMVYTIKE